MDKQEKPYEVGSEIGEETWNWSCGKYAPQANGSVAVQVGDTVVLATAVKSDKQRDGIDYLPLMVDYEEKLYAAGKIKGSRWVKREGRPTDEAILTSRVIDRSFRPMFDSDIRNDIQVIATVLSTDGENDPDIIALNAAAAAVEISDIPWDGPVAGVRVGKINGEFVVNPSFEEIKEQSKLDLIVSGTEDHIIMVEAGASEVPEEDMIAAIELAQREIKKKIKAIKELNVKAGKEKTEMIKALPDEDIYEKVKTYESDLETALYEAGSKEQRDKNLDNLKERILQEIEGEEDEIKSDVDKAFSKLMKKAVQENILQSEKRIDGRKLNEIRKITTEVGMLPRVHGSGLFQRGLTQVMTAITLGGPGDVQLLEDIDTEEERKKRYIHHYNFLPFSVGETWPMRHPGRREVGHGALAERALEPMIPDKESFPYTLRLVSEVLSSNGSTSMGATCGSTLALMDAGVPIKQPVSGIAMGLILNQETGDYKVLTDIQGIEDFNGHMDFKVAGSKNGITALQLDIKVKGLTVEILKDALSIAKEGRIHILKEMLKTISGVRKEMSEHAPRIVTIQIDPEKIRNVIGPGGKVINEIIEETGVDIDIDDDGIVSITSSEKEGMDRAVQWVKDLTREVKPGEIFEGEVVRIMDFGAFVEILPGQDGLVHISELTQDHVDKVTDVLEVGDKVKVKVKEIDDLGRINLSRKALLDKKGNEKKDDKQDNKPNLDDFVDKDDK